ncbi:SMI1/KNR4 family protein [Lysobacter enzymogenes]|uniref:SMI1/KNR4 family protein n=1 Tax=Lysobacter enzymogenes TaxID=69 RepID=UPI001A976EF9|nr:SMI1/KNR4 family protein [Lysobacter enzymogenes]QQP98176.1 SMI1/KNR4 family protein [Lysobacter enzymogenes]
MPAPDPIAIAEREIETGALLLLRLLPADRLRSTVYRALLKGRAVVLWPTRGSACAADVRAGFAAAVEDADLYFPGSQVAMPAGDYGGECIYVIHPMRTPLTLDTCPPGDDYRYRRQLLAAGVADGFNIGGLTPRQIAAVEHAQGVVLPRAYAAFLSECGRAAGSLCGDCHFFYPSLKGLKQDALEMLEEARQEAHYYTDFYDFHLPANAFVLAAYLGHQFAFCLCEGDEDPAVYRCIVGSAPERQHDSCSAYLDALIRSA